MKSERKHSLDIKDLWRYFDINNNNDEYIVKKILEINDLKEAKIFDHSYISKVNKYIASSNYKLKSLTVKSDALLAYFVDSTMFTEWANFKRIQFNTFQLKEEIGSLIIKYIDKIRNSFNDENYIDCLTKDLKKDLNQLINQYKKDIPEAVNYLKNFLLNGPKIKQDIILFRGIYVRPDIPEAKKYVDGVMKLKVDEEFGLPGFASFSQTPLYSLYSFAGDSCCLFRALFRKGTPIVFNYLQNEAVLWKPIFKVTKKTMIHIGINNIAFQVIDIEYIQSGEL